MDKRSTYIKKMNKNNTPFLLEWKEAIIKRRRMYDEYRKRSDITEYSRDYTSGKKAMCGVFLRMINEQLEE